MAANRFVWSIGGYTIVAAAAIAGAVIGRSAGDSVRPHFVRSFAAWSSSSEPEPESAPNVPPSEVFRSVLDKVQHDYVSTNTAKVTDDSLTEGALSRMLASLEDPHCLYLNPVLTDARDSAIAGKYYGIGAVLSVTRTRRQDIDYRYLTIQSIVPNGPAARAGLEAGDHITEVDGRWVIAYSVLSDTDRSGPTVAGREALNSADVTPGVTAVRAMQTLLTGSGQSHRITVESERQKTPRTVTLLTTETTSPVVQHRSLAPGVAYIKLGAFNRDSSALVSSALASPADYSKGLILDLRQSPGGVRAGASSPIDGYQFVLDLVGRFSGNSVFAQIENRPGQRQPLRSQSAQLASGPGCMVVLVDAGTANLAELAAAGLHDVASAKLVGEKTFGDDAVTAATALKGGASIELASAHILRASGQTLASGVEPDYRVRSISKPASDPTDSRSDPALQKAMALIRLRNEPRESGEL